jgi:hypothetical protein
MAIGKANVLQELLLLEADRTVPRRVAVYPDCPLTLSATCRTASPRMTCERLITVLQLVDRAVIDGTPEAIPGQLPDWFKGQFRPSQSKVEAEEWLNIWRKAPAIKQAEMQKKLGWDLDGLLYWLWPENRLWYLKSINWDERTLLIDIAVWDVPIPTEDFETVIQYCAAPDLVSIVIS